MTGAGRPPHYLVCSDQDRWGNQETERLGVRWRSGVALEGSLQLRQMVVVVGRHAGRPVLIGVTLPRMEDEVNDKKELTNT
jgi:hypothetical protein